MNNIDNAAEIIAKEWSTFSTRDLCGHEIGIARALRRAGLLMPDGMNTQTETVGPYFPEDEEMPDLPEGTVVTRIVGPWEEA